MEVVGFGGFALPKWLWIEKFKNQKKRKKEKKNSKLIPLSFLEGLN